MTIKICPFCDQEFDKEDLKSHIGSVHLGLEKHDSSSKEAWDEGHARMHD